MPIAYDGEATAMEGQAPLIISDLIGRGIRIQPLHNHLEPQMTYPVDLQS